MRAVSKTTNSAYHIHYHFVAPIKYRKAIFGFADRERSLVEISKEIEERYEITMEQIGIDTNHVHYLISAAPKYAPGNIIQIVKSITAREMFRRHPEISAPRETQCFQSVQVRY